MTASKLQPALLAGLVIGVLSALPVISLGNCLCCLWVVGGGALAAYLLQQNQEMPIEAGDGALAGLLAGLVGAVVTALLAIPLTMVLGPLQAEMIEQISQSAGDAPQFRELLDRLGTGGLGAAAILVSLVFNSIFYSVFGLLGGLLGQALFKKATPPPPPMPVFLDPMR